MDELLFREEAFQLVGFCMEIHRELGKGHDEVIYKDALVVELSRAQIPFSREKNYEITYKGVILPHFYYADFVVWDKILFEAKAAEKLTDAHVKQVLNYLAAILIRDASQEAGSAYLQAFATCESTTQNKSTRTMKSTLTVAILMTG